MRMLRPFKETSHERARTRWGVVLSGEGLEDFARKWWALFGAGVALPLWLGFTAVVAVIGGILGVLAEPYRLALVLIVSVPLVYRLWRSYRDLKITAAQGLGLEPREARKLDVSSPEALATSLARIRRAKDEC